MWRMAGASGRGAQRNAGADSFVGVEGSNWGTEVRLTLACMPSSTLILEHEHSDPPSQFKQKPLLKALSLELGG